MLIKFKLPKGKWSTLEVQDRHQLRCMMDNVLKDAKIKILDPGYQPHHSLYSRPMQRICGVA